MHVIDGRFRMYVLVLCCLITKGTFICQSKYPKELIEKFKMKVTTSSGTPMSPTCTLAFDDNGKTVDVIKYHGTIGSFLYLTVSRSDILFSICKYARF